MTLQQKINEIEKEFKKIIKDIVSTFIMGGNLPDIIKSRMPKIRHSLQEIAHFTAEELRIKKEKCECKDFPNPQCVQCVEYVGRNSAINEIKIKSEELFKIK